MEKISVVVSCYNEEESIPLFYNEIKKQDNTADVIFGHRKSRSVGPLKKLYSSIALNVIS